MELLFDTLLKGDPFGGIMVIEEQQGEFPLFESRPFSLHGEKPPSMPNSQKLSKKTFFVIDGQQRIQTLYMGLLGRFDDAELFFDLFSDHKTFFEFRFAADSRKLQRQVPDDEERPVRERKWYKVSALFDTLRRRGGAAPVEEVVDHLLEDGDRQDPFKEKAIRANVSAFWANIFSHARLGVDSVSLDRAQDDSHNRQRIVELFRRLNDGGTPLSSYDLFASMLKGFNWEMESFLEEMLRDYSGMGLNQDNLIKLVFILKNEPRKEMAEIHVEDADFAVQNREKISRALLLTQSFLKAAKMEEYFGSGNRSFIPLFFITHFLFFKDAAKSHFDNFDSSNPDFRPMRDWLFHSFLNSVFRSRGVGWNPQKTGITRILQVMNEAKGKAFPLEQLLQIYRDSLHYFTSRYPANELDQLDRDFTFYLTYDCSQAPYAQDIDHVHPWSKLLALEVPADKINSIANFQLLDFRTNRGRKNALLFHEWLNGGENGDRNVGDKPSFLKRHLIPDDPATHHIENFDQFLEARANLIASKIQTYFQV